MMSSPLRTLTELEAVITRGLQTFIEVGTALVEIRDRRLYQEAGFQTFEDYCTKRWGFHRGHAYRLIDAAEIARNVAPIGEITHETHARELLRLPDAPAMLAVWRDLKARFGSDITASKVRQLVHAYLTSPLKRPLRQQPVSPPSALPTTDLDVIHCGDTLQVLKVMPTESVDCIITSPPYYGLRDFGVTGQLGLENSLSDYLDKLMRITAELHRILKPTGTLWWNHGDSYATNLPAGTTDPAPLATAAIDNTHKGRANGGTIPAKSLMLQNYRLILRMIDEQGWILRNTIIWHKPNGMPESVEDRFTNDFDYLFFLVKSESYYFSKQQEEAFYDGRHETYMKGGGFGRKKLLGVNYSRQSPQTINYRGHERWQRGRNGEFLRNKRAVWSIPTQPFPELHFATFPEALIETPIKAGCPVGGVVLDLFLGSGTTAVVAKRLRRHYIGIELNPEYVAMAKRRLGDSVDECR